ncbi:MAG TPA: hypothetical protein VFQ41_13615 [Candidatus Angelobacter sp.]|nr:hypothetical protein [Candidatus Angelobacter sp.]
MHRRQSAGTALPEEHMSATQVRTTQPQRRAQDDAARVLNAALLQFDLAGEIRKLRQEDSWRRKAGRSAATLVKHGDPRLVLVAMRANSHMHEHKTSARISIQTIAGHIRLRLGEKSVDLPAGHLLVLDQALSHDVEALEDSAFLLTFSWPQGAEQISQKGRHEP